jgi:DNA-binding MarR family transcriptional regulator
VLELIVSTRYYLPVLETTPTPEQTVAELVEQLGHCACSKAFGAGMNPAQWAALRYFERANRFSRTVSAFAQFHGTTRGTASQTIRALVKKGYLLRLPAEHDQRSFRLDVTEAAQQVLGSDPFGEFVSAASALPAAQCSALARGLRAMLDRILEKRARRPFGVCTSCEHLRAVESEHPGDCGHHCRLQDELLEHEELGMICADHCCRQAQSLGRNKQSDELDATRSQ